MILEQKFYVVEFIFIQLTCASRQSFVVSPVDSLNFTCRWLREKPHDSAIVSLEYSGCRRISLFASSRRRSESQTRKVLPSSSRRYCTSKRLEMSRRDARMLLLRSEAANPCFCLHLIRRVQTISFCSGVRIDLALSSTVSPMPTFTSSISVLIIWLTPLMLKPRAMKLITKNSIAMRLSGPTMKTRRLK